MGLNINYGNGGNGILVSTPDECPFCHNKISPTVVFSHHQNNKVRVVFLCPAETCKQIFIGYYASSNGNPYCYLSETSIGKNKSKEFHKSINEISPSFVEIFNQAFASEQYGLTQICGVGYRKSLEFLIKDFAIKKHPIKEEEIKKNTLANVIKDYIEDSKIKIVSKRAVWLGNDETHYVRKWETKDLTDLKNLIDLTLTMIQAESDFIELQISMPE